MKATELRIGNYITTEYMNKSIFKVISIHSDRIYFESVRENFKSDTIQNYIKPIQLTEEWLFKFGFDKAVNGWWSSDEIFSYRDGYFGFGVDRYTKIQYVHELQNLYFALTGEDLTIQTKSKLEKMFGKQKKCCTFAE